MSSTLATKKKTSAPRRARAAVEPTAPRRGDLERALGARDPGALALARYAFAESQRTGRLAPAYLFEEWLADAIYERAAGVAQRLLGFEKTAIGDARPDHVDDSEGLARGLYFMGEV